MQNLWQKMLAAGCLAAAACSFDAALVMAAPAANDHVTVTILGTSDVHGRFVPWDYATDTEDRSGSLAQLSTAIRAIRAENPHTILVDAGDAIQDNSVEQFNTSPQQPMVVAMNQMGYDVWTMGNHEFNFGLDVLQHVVKQFKGHALCGNVYWDNGRRFLPAYTIVRTGGIRIGLIGMDTPMIQEFEKDSDHLKGVQVKDPVPETQKAIAALAGKTDALIGIMHMGVDNENDHPDTGVTDIAKACPQLWTSLKAYGEDAGTIRNMSIRYIREVKKGQLDIKPVNDWQTTGYDRTSAPYKAAAQALKAGQLHLHNSTDGKYTNIASITTAELKK